MTVATAAAVRVAVTVPAVGVTVATTSVAVAVAAVLEDEDTDQVDHQTEHGDDEQPLVLHLGRLDGALHRLGEDEEGDEEQEQAVDEATQHLRPHVSVRIALVGAPPGDHRCHQAGQQARAVKEHVERITDETQTVCGHAVEELDEGERQVEQQEEEQILGILIREDESHPAGDAFRHTLPQTVAVWSIFAGHGQHDGSRVGAPNTCRTGHQCHSPGHDFLGAPHPQPNVGLSLSKDGWKRGEI